MSEASRTDGAKPPVEKPGWRLTFADDFDRPQLNDMYWFPAYRSGRKEYFRRLGKPSRWVDHNAHTVIEDSVLKLRIDETLPFRPDKSTPCVSCVQTSDHRFGATPDEFQVLDKFAQKYGWFEVRCKCPRGEGLLSAFWLHQCDPTKQEYTPDGRRREVGEGVVEIDIIEQQGRLIGDASSAVDLNVHFTPDAHYRPEVGVDASSDFHVWAMEWQEGRIDWYLDGTRLQTYEGPTPQERMFVLMALFQYSGWIGEIDPQMSYPRDLEVDYVRVYARETG
ncbi:glycoside hydrolase family 16 protein [bacterium]|nr:glycoside hydrolase family 16 protein [bacterium]